MMLIFFTSCRDEQQKALITNFEYQNKSAGPVELRLISEQGNEVHPIAKNGSFKLARIEKAEHLGDTGLLHPFPGYTKVIIAFPDLNKCTANYDKILDVKRYDNFNETMYNNSENTVLYLIDEEELNAATNCN